MDKTFHTPDPTSVYVELGAGLLEASAGDVTETTVHVDGQDADDVTVERRGDQIVVLAPPRRTGFFATSSELRVNIAMPRDSELATKLGSADVVTTGRLGTCRLKTGSGDVRVEELGAAALVETGSGDVMIDTARAELRVKTGSGDVEVNHLGGATAITTGSGDVELGHATDAVQVKSGSGDARVREADTDLALSTASGDLLVGRFARGELIAKNVSGDIRVAIPAGVPVWTDISCLTGSVRSNLDGAGRPAPGQDYVELRAKTVSGDIALEQL